MSKIRKSYDRGSSADKSSDKPFEVKHRIAGAVVLMLVAVVVIPLLLTDPGVEANNSASDNNRTGGREFQSRIVPLNINNANSGNQATNQSTDQASTVVNVGNVDNARVVDDDRPALLDLTGSGDAESGDAESGEDQSADNTVLAAVPGPSEEAPAQEVPESEVSAAQPEAVDGSVSEQAEPESETVVMTPQKQPEPSKPASEPEQQPESAAQQALDVASIDDQQVVRQGWVVRVGTFSKSANVDSVSTLLTSSGFKPKKTPVATSLGQSTRVWLGPYAKRETADKISDRLKSLTGEKGYVTKTSS